MRVLIAMERSGVIRRAFRARGHDAWSCDLFPAEDGGEHIQSSALDHDVANGGWDLMIAHPDCTFLTVSANAWAGAEWRIEARFAALHTVRALWAFPVPMICIENPVGVLRSFFRPHDQIIQPYEFGHDASKQTCLWLKNLPPLRPTNFIEPRMVNGKPRWSNQTDSGQNALPPSADRWMERARTYEGIANAMAEQWGDTPKIARNAEGSGIFNGNKNVAKKQPACSLFFEQENQPVACFSGVSESAK